MRSYLSSYLTTLSSARSKASDINFNFSIMVFLVCHFFKFGRKKKNDEEKPSMANTICI
ncbi:hypothetical protein LguiB_021227 [Lonicera macranthoides]